MAARTFTDAAGVKWEVFEVHRASKKAGAVSPGLENGWLAFASGVNKRRLAPIPSGWDAATDTELEALCESARHAPTPRYPLDRPVRPRIRRNAKGDQAYLSERVGTADVADAADAAGIADAADAAGIADMADTAPTDLPRISPDVEDTVRAFAHDARARGLPVVTAMLELKTILRQHHPDLDFGNRDRQLVRRWFVDAYYFERNA